MSTADNLMQLATTFANQSWRDGGACAQPGSTDAYRVLQRAINVALTAAAQPLSASVTAAAAPASNRPRLTPAGSAIDRVALRVAASQVVRNALDEVDVHPRDQANDSVRARELVGPMRDLYEVLNCL